MIWEQWRKGIPVDINEWQRLTEKSGGFGAVPPFTISWKEASVLRGTSEGGAFYQQIMDLLADYDVTAQQ